MKKIKTLCCLAAAALTITGCSNVEDFIPEENKDNIFVIKALMPPLEVETRPGVIIGDVNPDTGYPSVSPKWIPGDKTLLWWIDDVGNERTPLHSNEVHLDSDNFGTFSYCDPENVILHSPGFVITTDIYNIQPYVARGCADFYGVRLTNVEPNVLAAQNEMLITKKTKGYYKRDGLQGYMFGFRRVNGVLRINIEDKTTTGVKQMEGTALDRIKIYSPEEEALGNSFMRKVSYDMQTGELTKVEGGSADPLVAECSKTNPLIIGKKNNQLYLSCVPAVMHKGNTLAIAIVNSQDKVAYKEVKLERDVKVSSGVVSTFNISFTDDDIVKNYAYEDAAANEPKVAGSVIEMRTPGYLSKDIMNEAVGKTGNGGTFKIIGAMNGRDISMLSGMDYLAGKVSDVTLDLSGMSFFDIKKNRYYASPIDKMVTFNNQVLSEYMVCCNDNFFSKIILPDNITDIKKNAVVIKKSDLQPDQYDLWDLVLGKNVVNIAKDAIVPLDRSLIRNLYVKAHYDTAKGYESNFISGFEDPLEENRLAILYLHESWKAHQDEIKEWHAQWFEWKGINCFEIKYIDDDGNIVP